jgi:hypothetical protein
MSINNMHQYLASLPDWGFLGKLAPGDADGLREKNGRLLLLECKQSGVPIPRGQHITFDSMVARGDSVLVIRMTPASVTVSGLPGGAPAVEHTPGHVVAVQVWGKTVEYTADEAEVLRLVTEWNMWATTQPRPAPVNGWVPSRKVSKFTPAGAI